MAVIQDVTYPEDLYYDIENQIWYEPLEDGTIRAGFTPIAMKLLGDVLAFTPRRVNRPFVAGKSIATIEGGKWVGAAEAAFPGVVIGANESLERRPKLLNEDAFGAGWMVLIEPAEEKWREGLMTGSQIGPALEAWIKAEEYKSRVE